MAKRLPKITGGVRVMERLPRELSATEVLETWKKAHQIEEDIAAETEAFENYKKEVKANLLKKKFQAGELKKVAKEGVAYEQREAIRTIANGFVHFFDETGEEIYSRPASDADMTIQMFENDAASERAAEA